MPGKRVLVTGMSGIIGGAVRRALEGRHELTALNRRDVPGVRCFRADITDMAAIQPAFDGQEVVVHLAAYLKPDWAGQMAVNIGGTYNVFEAARKAGVKRIVFASSGATVMGYESEPPYSYLAKGDYAAAPPTWPLLTHDVSLKPNGLYATTKAWAEALGRYYSDHHGISVICLRYGRVRAEDRPVDARDWAAWCSQRDAGQMVKCCVEAPDSVRHDIFYVASDNRWGFRDLKHAQQVVGYVPQDHAEDWRGKS